MINQELSDKLIRFLQEYLSFYKKFLQLETDKYSDMTNNNLRSLDERVKTEEAFMLKSRGLEIERDRLVAETGSPKSTFQQLIPLFDPSRQTEAKEIYLELSKVLLDLKEMNQRCNSLTELKLHTIDVTLHKIENNPELQKLYDEKARAGNVPPRIFSKKI